MALVARCVMLLLETSAVLTLLLVAHVSGNGRQTGGVAKFADQCWPYSAEDNRTALMLRQAVNQKAMYRTPSSYWCSVTDQLTGIVLILESADAFLADAAAGYVAKVRWNNGIVGFHRMGIHGDWDLDTNLYSSAQLKGLDSFNLTLALRAGTTVFPTSYNSPGAANAWQRICSIGIVSSTGRVGALVNFNSDYGVATVEWPLSQNSDAVVTGFYRFNADAYDVCFSGCADFLRYTTLSMAAFGVCNYVVPSPSLLQSSTSNEAGVREQFIVLPPYYVGVEVTEGSVSQPYYVSNLAGGKVTFVNILSEAICILTSSMCPDWDSLDMPLLILLLPNATLVSDNMGLWRGKVVWPPGHIVTQMQLGEPYQIRDMGVDNNYEFCLADISTRRTCPISSIVTPTANSTMPANTTEAPGALTDCSLNLIQVFYVILVPFAVFCFIYLAFRRPGRPFRLSLKPTLPVPVNLLDFRVNRALIALAYGATVQIVYLLLIGQLKLDLDTNKSKWLDVVIRLLLTLVIGLAFYIIFAGITTLHQPEGHIMGLICSIFFIVFYSLRIVSCKITSKVVLGFQAVPALSCLLILAVYFSKRIVSYIFSIGNDDGQEALLLRNQLLQSTGSDLPYLRALLKRDREAKKAARQEQLMRSVEGRKSKFQLLSARVRAWFAYHLPLPRLSDPFSYSPLYLSSVVLGMTGVYMVIVSLLPDVLTILELFSDATISLAEVHGKSHAVRSLFQLMPYGLLLALIISTMFLFMQCLHMIATYKRHMLRLYKGDWSFMSRDLPRPLNQLKAFGRFLGIQTAYIMYGFLIMFFVMSLTFFLIGGFFIAFEYFESVRSFVYAYVIPAATTAVLVALLIQIFVYLAMDKQATAKFAVIRCPKFYNNFAFFLVFYNVVLGLFNVLMRMLLVAAFNTVMILRLNRPLMPRGWEKYDYGYYCYCGVLQIELSHTHPCMLAFVALVEDAAHQPVRVSRAARRWHLAYTLLNNPRLIKLRLSHAYPHRHCPRSRVGLISDSSASMSVSIQSLCSYDAELSPLAGPVFHCESPRSMSYRTNEKSL